MLSCFLSVEDGVEQAMQRYLLKAQSATCLLGKPTVHQYPKSAKFTWCLLVKQAIQQYLYEHGLHDACMQTCLLLRFWRKMYDIQVLFTIVRRPGRNYDFLVGKSTIYFF